MLAAVPRASRSQRLRTPVPAAFRAIRRFQPDATRTCLMTMPSSWQSDLPRVCAAMLPARGRCSCPDPVPGVAQALFEARVGAPAQLVGGLADVEHASLQLAYARRSVLRGEFGAG